MKKFKMLFPCLVATVAAPTTCLVGCTPLIPYVKCTFTVNFVSGVGGEITGSQYFLQTVEAGTKWSGITKPQCKPNTGYTFDAWYREMDGKSQKIEEGEDFVIPGNITISAHFTSGSPVVETFTVSFDSKGGTTVPSQKVVSGEKAVEPKQPTYDGHTFVGWFKQTTDTNPFDFANTPIIGNTELFAKWVETPAPTPTYLIYFKTGGHGTVTGDTEQQISGKPFFANVVDKVVTTSDDGYVFDAWYDKNDIRIEKTDTDYRIESDNTFVARFKEVEKFDVTFYTNTNDSDPSIYTTQSVKDQECAIEPAQPTRDFYTFNDWYTDRACSEGNKFDFTTKITKKTDLYAKWTQTMSTVTFTTDGNGKLEGAVSPGTTIKLDFVPNQPKGTYWSTFVEKGKVPTPIANAGFSFSEWYVDGEIIDDDEHDRGFLKSFTATAVFVPVPTAKFDVEFDANGGSPTPKTQQVEKNGYAIKPEQPTWWDHTFKHWYKQGTDSSTPFDFENTPITEKTKLIASWEEVVQTITISFHTSANGTLTDGTETGLYDVDKTTTTTKLLAKDWPTPVPNDKTKYRFKNWSLGSQTMSEAEDLDVYSDVDIVANFEEIPTEMCTLTFVSNGGTQVPSQTIPKGGLAIEPKEPTKKDNTFEGWYTDNGTFQNRFTFTIDKIQNNPTLLYANWIQSQFVFSFAGVDCTIFGSSNYTEKIDRNKEDVKFTVMPNKGYKLSPDQDLPDGVTLVGNTLTIANMDKDYMNVRVVAITEAFTWKWFVNPDGGDVGDTASDWAKLDEFLKQYPLKPVNPSKVDPNETYASDMLKQKIEESTGSFSWDNEYVAYARVNGVIHKVRLIGFDHDVLSNDSAHYAPTTWEFKNLISDSSGYSLTAVWRDCYSATENPISDYINYSTLRKLLTDSGTGGVNNKWYTAASGFPTVKPAVYSMIGDDSQGTTPLYKAIKSVSKYVNTYEDTSTSWVEKPYSDKMFALTTYEMGYADATHAETQNCSPYNFYQDCSESSSKQKRIHKQVNEQTIKTQGWISPNELASGKMGFIFAGQNTASDWSGGGQFLLASPYIGSTSQIQAWSCSSDGSLTQIEIYSSTYAIAPAFSI